jgi:hypothetical protein
MADLTPAQRELQRVVCAACKKGDVILLGARHFDGWMHRQMDAMGRDKLPGAEQGFIDQFGNFLTRTEAWRIAFSQGQVIRRCGGDHADGGTLYSENLY